MQWGGTKINPVLVKSLALSTGSTLSYDASPGTYMFVGHAITRGRAGEGNGYFSSSGKTIESFSTELGTKVDTSVENAVPRCTTCVAYQVVSASKKINFSWSGGSGYATANLRIYRLL